MVTGEDHWAPCGAAISCHPFWEEVTSRDWSWNPSWKSSVWRWLCSSTTILPFSLCPHIVTTRSFDSIRKHSLTNPFFCMPHEFLLLIHYISYVWGRGGTCLTSSTMPLHGCSEKSSLKMSNMMYECFFKNFFSRMAPRHKKPAEVCFHSIVAGTVWLLLICSLCVTAF